MVDQFKGRIALNRRWPAGLHTAVEAKEGVSPKSQGMVLGSTTIQHLAALYPRVCGMTGTANSRAANRELTRESYGMSTLPTSEEAGACAHGSPARPVQNPLRSGEA